MNYTEIFNIDTQTFLKIIKYKKDGMSDQTTAILTGTKIEQVEEIWKRYKEV